MLVFQGVAHGRRGVAAQARHPMAVGVERELNLGVAERDLHVLWVDALRQQQGRVSVPEVVPTDVRQLRPLKRKLEVPVDAIRGVERRADGGREGEVMVPPRGAGSKPFFHLALGVAPEGLPSPYAS